MPKIEQIKDFGPFIEFASFVFHDIAYWPLVVISGGSNFATKYFRPTFFFGFSHPFCIVSSCFCWFPLQSTSGVQLVNLF